MPLQNREIFQLGLILLCVPAQYFLATYFDGAAGRSQTVFEMINDIRKMKDSLFSLEVWKQRWLRIVSALVKVYFPEGKLKDTENNLEILFVEPDTCPPLDVIRYRRKEGYFGSSTEVRSERPDEVKFRIGQVVFHRTRGYRAVIVGWDTVPKAPEKWFEKTYGIDKDTRDEPHYILLVDDRDLDLLEDEDFIEFSVAPETYVMQAYLALLKDTEIESPDVKKRFEYFDGAQYIPGPALKAIYPMD